MLPALQLHPLPALSDNYIWLLHDGAHALVVDPGAAAPVTTALQTRVLALDAIFITHHHHDHIHGLPALYEGTHTSAALYAPPHPRNVPQAQHVHDGSRIQALGLQWQVLATPGHVPDHVCYYSAAVPLAEGPRELLFCGDTLFSAGCGRIFEGSAEQLYASIQLLAQLPQQTLVCCTHEYTLTNLRFALSLEPDNAQLLAYYAHCANLRARQLPTLPTTIAQEWQINPFIRAQQPDFARLMQLHFRLDSASPLAVFTALRQARNAFA